MTAQTRIALLDFSRAEAKRELDRIVKECWRLGPPEMEWLTTPLMAQSSDVLVMVKDPSCAIAFSQTMSVMTPPSVLRTEVCALFDRALEFRRQCRALADSHPLPHPYP